MLKLARSLKNRKQREESGLFVVEGIRPVTAAIDAGWEVTNVLVDPDRLHSAHAKSVLTNYAGRLDPVSSGLLDGITGKENPQGLVALVKQKTPPLDQVVAAGRYAALVEPQDPGNVGTILRTLEAVGGKTLFVLDGGVDAYHPTAIRAAMGATFWIPVIRAQFAQFANWQRQNHVRLIGTSAHAVADYRGFRSAEPWCLLLGSEQKGLDPQEQSACDTVISIPMRGRGSSLNLAVAAGILLYELTSA